MRLAIVATPSLHRDQRPAPGSLDGDLIRARLSLDDAGFRVIDVDPARDLAEQLDAMFDELVATRQTLVDAEEAAREEASTLLLFYASSAVALSPDGELFLCLDPENPGVGDALSDVAAVFRDRARGEVLFVIECHHAPGAASRAVVAAAERAVASAETGIELLVAAHPIGSLGADLPSVLTRAFVEHLDEAEPERGLTAGAIARRIQESSALSGAIPCFARAAGRGSFFVLVPPGGVPIEEPAAAPRHGAAGPSAAAGDERAAAGDERAAAGDERAAAGGERAGAAGPRAAAPAPPLDDSVARYLAAGDALAAAPDLEGALSAYKKALALVGTAHRDARAEVYLRIAHVRRRQERHREAIEGFEKALALAPEHRPALEALCEAHLAARDLAGLRTAEERLLSRIEGDDDRLAYLVQAAERWEIHAGDTDRARELLERARELRPDDASVLRSLGRLYEEAGDVQASLDARRCLIERIEDPRQRALSFLDLARAAIQGEARATLTELTREQTGIDLLERALDADPTLLDPLALIAVLLSARQEWGELELAYRRMLDRAQRIADPRTRSDVVWELCRRLGLLFRDHLEDPGSALDAFEGAVAERPDDVAGRLNAASLARSAGRLERAAAHLQAAAVLDPGNAQVFHDLFDAFQKLRRTDQAWAAASVTMYLGAAEARERFLFEEHRPAGLVQPARGLSAGAWDLLRAADRDRALEEVLASVTGAAIRARLTQRAREKKVPRLDPAARAEAERSAAGVVRLFAWASRCLGIAAPAVYFLKDAQIGVAAVPVGEPSVLVGGEALRGRTAAELAFLVGSHVAYHVGPHRLLLHFPTLEELGVCLAAAVKLVRPSEPVPSELDGAVRALVPLLDKELTAVERDALEAAVFELYEIHAPLDLAHWVGSVERCAARVGYLLTGELSVAASSLSRADVPGVLTAEEKIGDLLSFTVSDAHHALREELGVAIQP
ncbi:tetratricopeptide repeat protein [Sorangium sp. So ce1024]|uniref:tetratricopeptide repeat protein n=1 Tax=Sorangium sp. So ce1024 TaxID=3133327 RepID=UPI003F070691